MDIENLIEKIETQGEIIEIPGYSGKCYRLLDNEMIYELLSIDGLKEEEISEFYNTYELSIKVMNLIASAVFNRSIEKETLCLENRVLISYGNLKGDGLNLSDLEELGNIYFSSDKFSRKLSKYIKTKSIDVCTEETILEYVNDNTQDVAADIIDYWKSLN